MIADLVAALDSTAAVLAAALVAVAAAVAGPAVVPGAVLAGQRRLGFADQGRRPLLKAVAWVAVVPAGPVQIRLDWLLDVQPAWLPIVAYAGEWVAVGAADLAT